MEVVADVRQAKDSRTYDLLMAIDEGENKADLAYNLKVNKKIVKEDETEHEIFSLDLNDDPSANIKGEIKSGDLLSLFQTTDTILWTDYLVNSSEESEKISYEFNLDDKQYTKDADINVDYFENTKEGYVLKREFSQAIPFAKKIEFEIPKGYIAKLSLKTRVDKKNTNIKNYSLNNRQVKNPRYVEDKNTKSTENEDEVGKESDNHIKVIDKETEKPEKTEKIEKPENRLADSQITVTDGSGNEIPVEEKDKNSEEKQKPKKEENKAEISAIILNKDSLIARLIAEGRLNDQLEASIEGLAKNLDLYNEEKITDQDLKDFTKAQATNNNIEKSDLRFYLESILSGLNKQKNKAANINYDEIIAYAYPERVNQK